MQLVVRIESWVERPVFLPAPTKTIVNRSIIDNTYVNATRCEVNAHLEEVAFLKSEEAFRGVLYCTTWPCIVNFHFYVKAQLER